ncbi:MAG: BrnA antitoxin family protein [Rhodobacterales bacterium]|jgi:uncharacterized protein (DUF4415 family)|nr:BrnA antitoxin family protein [Pseudomonadota bacterium]MDA1285836.1 BrnA antitoxin family protein [Pseudomonadota bacterium]NQW14281.1 BrnA antitoxin family protein [Rhodobacter sp.]
MKDPEKLTKKERVDLTMLMDAMAQTEFDLLHPIARHANFPATWREIALEGANPTRTRITARFDADVVKFFRSLGPGYQDKMNRVLKSWMLMRLTGLLEGPEGREVVERVKAFRERDGARPKFGDTDRMFRRED